MPLEPNEQAELDRLEYEKLLAEKQAAQASDSKPFYGNLGENNTAPRLKRAMGAGMTADLALEAGLPMAAQALTTELTPAGQAVVGSGASVLGNILAQTRRVLSGEQPSFQAGQVVQAGVTGAVPFAGPLKNAERVSHPFISAVGRTALEGGRLAAIGAGGEILKTEIDEGRLPTKKEMLYSAGIPGIVGAGASVGGDLARSLSDSGRRVAENSKDLAILGETPTPGMLLPETFASAEARKASNSPGSALAAQRDRVYGSLQSGIQNVAPNPQEGAAIFDQAKPLMRQISTAEDTLGQLNEEARLASERAAAAAAKMRAAQDAAKAGAKAELVKASNEALDANLGSALQNAKDLAAAQVTGGAGGIDRATARDLFVQHVAKPIEAAFQQRSAELYSGVDNLKAAFNSQPIIAKADELATSITGGLPKKLESAVNVVKDTLGNGEPVSLQALRNARAELLRKVQLGEFGSSAEEKMIKDISHEITDQIEKQAVKALGPEQGQALLEANKFYRETRPLFDAKGVDVLFSASPGDQYVRNVLNGMKEAGINSEEYRNLTALTKKIGEFNPELGAAAESHANDLLKRSVIFDASRINPASPTGELLVDTGDLLKSLNDLGKVPGTLEKLNLGNSSKVAELNALFAKYPEAGKLTSEDWNALMRLPAFQDVTSKAPLANQLEPALASAQADNLLLRSANLNAAGKADEAARAYAGAIRTLDSVNGDLNAARAKYEQLLKDPVALAWNNPNLASKDFNGLAKSLFEAKANKVTNEDVRALVDALRKSPTAANRELLQHLQERYIADRVASYHSTPVTSEMLQQPSAKKIAEFFNPANPADAANEIERAKAILTPDQFSRLEQFADAAKSLNRYEKMQGIYQMPGSREVPVVGQIRRGIDVVTDLYRAGKYNTAAWMLSNPERFSRWSTKVGDAGSSLQGIVNAAAMAWGREPRDFEVTPEEVPQKP